MNEERSSLQRQFLRYFALTGSLILVFSVGGVALAMEFTITQYPLFRWLSLGADAIALIGGILMFTGGFRLIGRLRQERNRARW